MYFESDTILVQYPALQIQFSTQVFYLHPLSNEFHAVRALHDNMHPNIIRIKTADPPTAFTYLA